MEKMKKNKEPYFTLDNLKRYNADYNIIIGERSNGKTTAVLKEILINFLSSKEKVQGAYIRRWEEDIKGKNATQLFDTCLNLGWIEKYSNNKYNNVKYYSGKWFLTHVNSKGEIDRVSENPMCFGFSINNEEHYKSVSFPNIYTILFDEFITRDFYLTDEFIHFQSLLSTIIRLKDNVKIYMCGNTVNKYCPYFNEMGLTDIRKMKQGTIDLYTYGDSGLKVAVEYSDFKGKKKKSNKYFAFNNPKLNMIKNGAWEIALYPHLPYKYKEKDIIYKFFIIFEREILQCEVISISEPEDSIFIYIHRKTTPIDDSKNENEIVYTTDYSSKINYRRNIFVRGSKIETEIVKLISLDKIFYQDNEVGEIVKNYFLWCQNNDAI